MHHVRPNLPDECNFGMRLDARSSIYWATAPNYDYLDWFLAEVRAGTTLRAEQQSVVEFAIVADLDMAGARGSAFAALHAIRP